MISKILFILRIVTPIILIIIGYLLNNKFFTYIAVIIVFTLLILKETKEFWNKIEKPTFEEFVEQKKKKNQ
jgi:4-hydroxybenzoate polyprenyltransferase